MSEDLKIPDDFDNAAAQMAEGDSKAIEVLSEIREVVPQNWKTVMSALGDMNMTGVRITTAFNYVNRDMKDFMEAINTRDADMVAHVNTSAPDSDSNPNPAVEEGALADTCRRLCMV